MKKIILIKWMHWIRSVIIIRRYTSLFLHLIENDSFDWAIRLLQKKGSTIANAQIIADEDYEGGYSGRESALMLATSLKQVSKAIELIDALMYSGADMYTHENRYYGHVFFFACRNGVDPAIFNKLLMWDSMRKNEFQEWWSICDINGNGVFVLACEGHNISLAEHILSLAFTHHHQKNFLKSMPNHILKSLHVHHKDCFDERFMVKWLRLLRKYVDEIPQEYTIPLEKNCIYSDPIGDQHLPYYGENITLSGPFLFALKNGMYDFMEEYAALFNADYKYKETIWRWLHKEGNRSVYTTGIYAVPIIIRKFALSYERSELWKRNKDIILVLLRAFEAKYQSDILEHVSSFVYTTSLDAKARDEEKRDARYCCECKGWYVGLCVDKCAQYW
jgi:hypothetical protein